MYYTLGKATEFYIILSAASLLYWLSTSWQGSVNMAVVSLLMRDIAFSSPFPCYSLFHHLASTLSHICLKFLLEWTETYPTIKMNTLHAVVWTLVSPTAFIYQNPNVQYGGIRRCSLFEGDWWVRLMPLEKRPQRAPHFSVTWGYSGKSATQRRLSSHCGGTSILDF